MNPLYRTALLALGLVLSNVAHAHIGVHANGSFETGLLHPLSGMDHALVMIAVGLWAVQSGGRNVIFAPAAFMTAMVLGAMIGVSGGLMPFAEPGIALSVAVLGLLLALAVRGSWKWSAPLIAMFALFHGFAHGAEIPQFASPASYFAGFLMATLLLHACGIAAAITLKNQATALRAGGAVIGLAGMWMALAA